jgi:hypothetical protein
MSHLLTRILFGAAIVAVWTLASVDAFAQGRSTRIAPGVTFTPYPSGPTSFAPGVTYTPYSSVGQPAIQPGTLAPGVSFSSVGPGSSPGNIVPSGLAFTPYSTITGSAIAPATIAPGVIVVPGSNPAQGEGNVVTTATAVPPTANLVVPTPQAYPSYLAPQGVPTQPIMGSWLPTTWGRMNPAVAIPGTMAANTSIRTHEASAVPPPADWTWRGGQYGPRNLVDANLNPIRILRDGTIVPR